MGQDYEFTSVHQHRTTLARIGHGVIHHQSHFGPQVRGFNGVTQVPSAVRTGEKSETGTKSALYGEAHASFFSPSGYLGRSSESVAAPVRGAQASPDLNLSRTELAVLAIGREVGISQPGELGLLAV